MDYLHLYGEYVELHACIECVAWKQLVPITFLSLPPTPSPHLQIITVLNRFQGRLRALSPDVSW